MIHGCQRKDVDAQEGVPNYKLDARPRQSDVVDDEVDAVRGATDGSVEGTRPDLRVTRQYVRYPPDFEHEREQIRILIRGDTEEASSRDRGTAGQGLVFLERICKARHRMSALHVNHLVSTRNSPVAMRMRVVPVSTIPAVFDKIVVLP